MINKSFLFVLFLVFGVFVIPHESVQAQEDLDQKCFTRQECMAARAEMNLPVEDQGKGFYNNTAETRRACLDRKDSSGVELGFCLPAGQSETSVKFGGTSKFANIGIFIQYIYRYGVIFAGILAVIVIIVAGLQWTASGGNSSTIETSKHRITGAVTGLVLASTSYIILNTINPSTLNLRLPQVWLIRESAIENEYKYCMAIPAVPEGESGWIAPQIAPYQENYEAISNWVPAFGFEGNDRITSKYFPIKLENPVAKCGEKMVIKDTQGNSCIGTYCASGVCFDDKKECAQLAGGNGIVGRISWEPGKYVDQIWLKVACETDDGWEVEDIESVDLGEAKNFYKFENVINEAIDECDGRQNVKGFFFIMEVNDSDNLNTNDDQWIGGRSFCSQAAGNSCGFYGDSSIDSDDAEEWVGALYDIQELFSLTDVEKGLPCDLRVTTEAMPNLGNGATVLFFSGIGHLGGKTTGAFADALFDVNSGNAAGKATCPYLEKRDQEFDKAIKARYKAKYGKDL